MDIKTYDNRELSWLKFNKRVLEEAQDVNVPLLERLNFAAIFSSNLDEFFMVRVGSLHDQIILNDNTRENKTNLTASEQLDVIFKKVSKLVPLKDKVYSDISQCLLDHGIQQVSFSELTKDEEEFFEYYFIHEILPLISPQVIDKRHSFPFLNNKDIYVVARLESKSNVKLGMVKASGVFERVLFLPGEIIRFMLVEELILHFVPKIFDNYKVEEKSLIRVTRNADINTEEGLVDYDLDFRSVMTELLKKRKKLSPVRLETSRKLSDNTIEELCGRLELKKEQVFLSKSPLDMSFVYPLMSKSAEKKELFYQPVEPQRSSSVISDEPVIKQIMKKDILLSYPFESIRPFIRLLREAAVDPQVVSIKITLYRVRNNFV